MSQRISRTTSAITTMAMTTSAARNRAVESALSIGGTYVSPLCRAAGQAALPARRSAQILHQAGVLRAARQLQEDVFQALFIGRVFSQPVSIAIRAASMGGDGGAQLLHRAGSDQMALVDDGDPVAHLLGDLE